MTDVLRLQIQIKAMESDLLQLEVDKRPLMVRFNQLLGRDKNELVNFETNFSTQKDMGWEVDMLEKILVTNPMLLMLEKEGLVYQKQGEMAKLEGKPMFGLGLNYMVFSPRPEMGVPGGMNGMDYMPAGMGNNMIMPMATLSLPIFRGKYKAMSNQAKYKQQAIEQDINNTKGLLEVQWQQYSTELNNLERDHELYNAQYKLAEK